MTLKALDRFRTTVGIGLTGAAGLILLLLAAPAAAQDGGVVLDVSATGSVQGEPGDTLRVDVSVVNSGTEDMAGGSLDFEVPDGVTVTGIVDQELAPGTERPAEGCALVTPQRIECHTEGTLTVGGASEATFEVRIDDGAPAGELGAATVLAEGDDGGSGSATTVVFVRQGGEVVLEATMEPQNVFAPPGSVASLDTTVTNTGSADMVGGIVDFEVTGNATVVGIEGEEFVDGTERPDEGCALVTPQRVECHTAATLAVGDTAEATFLVQLPGNMSETVVGDAVLHVAGDNGGEDTVTSVLEVGPHEGYRFLVSAPASVEVEQGDVVDVFTTVGNVGSVDVEGASIDFEVPAGATVVGIDGQEFVDGTERPDEGCALVTPQRVECHTDATLVAYDGYINTTFEVRIDDDTPAGELGVARIHAEGDEGGEDTVRTAETIITVIGDGGGAENGGTENSDDDDELPDTGAGSLPTMLAAIGMLAAGGAAMVLRARRS